MVWPAVPVVVFTACRVPGGKPVLYVYHHDDGAWQFHSEPDLKDSKLLYGCSTSGYYNLLFRNGHQGCATGLGFQKHC